MSMFQNMVDTLIDIGIPDNVANIAAAQYEQINSYDERLAEMYVSNIQRSVVDTYQWIIDSLEYNYSDDPYYDDAVINEIATGIAHDNLDSIIQSHRDYYNMLINMNVGYEETIDYSDYTTNESEKEALNKLRADVHYNDKIFNEKIKRDKDDIAFEERVKEREAKKREIAARKRGFRSDQPFKKQVESRFATSITEQIKERTQQSLSDQIGQRKQGGLVQQFKDRASTPFSKQLQRKAKPKLRNQVKARTKKSSTGKASTAKTSQGFASKVKGAFKSAVSKVKSFFKRK